MASDLRETRVGGQELFKGDFLHAMRDRVRLPDGQLTQREYIVHPGAVMIVPWLQGPGRIHMRCRSTSTPVTKSWRELGIPVDEMSPGERASMDGQVPADQTFGQWLRKQSASRQDEVLGPVRGAMFRAGAPLDSFYDARGRYLTLDELRQR